jgi:uncharacterized protein YpuA (DUF1002 family)
MKSEEKKKLIQEIKSRLSKASWDSEKEKILREVNNKLTKELTDNERSSIWEDLNVSLKEQTGYATDANYRLFQQLKDELKKPASNTK